MRKLKNKITKISRFAQYRLARPSYVPVFWHVGTPNFGDDINPWFLSKVSGQKFRFANNQKEDHFLGVGSILDHATAGSTVLGSGLLSPLDRKLDPDVRIISVRGELTAQSAGCDDDILLGDPMVLINLLIDTKNAPKHKLGIIPHVRSFEEINRILGKSHTIIDPAAHPSIVLDQINSCSLIASQSLHGLIAADALDVPNIWISPSSNMQGGCFKFRDYFTTIDHPKEQVSIVELSKTDLDELPFSVGKYLYDKEKYLSALKVALHNRSPN